MKKVVSFKKLIIALISISLILISTFSYATDSVLETGDGSSSVTEITTNEYDNALTIPEDTNTVNNTTNNTSTSQGITTNSAYNTVDEDNTTDEIPQTGIEDGYIGVLLIVFVGISIFTFKKMRDYKNI